MTSFAYVIFLFLYRFVLYPALLGAFRVLSLFDSKIRSGLMMRKRDKDGVWPWLRWPPGLAPIWIHCASGEFEYAKPVIKSLKSQYPELKILVTYFSPTFAGSVSKFPGVDFSCPLPFDTPRLFREFIDHHRPQCLLISRTDTWPIMLHETRRAQIPSLLFSATLSERSGRARGLGRWVSKFTFANLTQIFCVGEDDFFAFSGLGFDNCTRVAGDTRYDQVLARLADPKPLKEELFTPTKTPTLVAGSTWPEDEAVLLDVIEKFYSEQSTIMRFVIVPHEPTPEHLESLRAQLKAKNLPFATYSTASEWNEPVLLIDRIGLLAELYTKGDFAFVGGSFRKSVHSVMEPLAAGCLTFVGPHHLANREALEFKSIPLVSKLSLTCVKEVTSAEGFSLCLIQALRKFSSEDREHIRNEVQNRCGKSALVAGWTLAHWTPPDL